MSASTCDHGDVRMVGSNHARDIGRYVEVCIRGAWERIDGQSWNDTSASVICRQLGFSPWGKHFFLSL